MAFEMPSDLSALTTEDLQALLAEAVAEQQELVAKDDADLTDADLERLQALVADGDSITARITEIDAEATARADSIAALRAKVPSPEAAPTEEPPAAAAEEPPPTEPVAVVEEVTEPVSEEEREAVTASSAAARAAANAPVIVVPEEPPVVHPITSLVASANVPGFDSGSEYGDMLALSEGFQSRARAFEGRSDEGWDRYGVAKIKRPESEFVLDSNMSAEAQTEVLQRVVDEHRLPGGSLAMSSLTAAAGGWCAPSETSYDFCPTPMPDDLGSYPEVQIRRGGMRYTKGPDLASLTATWGFLQTEAQAEASTPKVCYEIDCPPFVDVRLEAIGFCITAGLLTNAAYPELVRDVLAKGTILHRLKVDKYIYDKIKAGSGAAINFTEVGSATGDILSALELNAEVIRAKYLLPRSHTVEVLLPSWTRGVIRQDLSFRNGVDLLAVTDSTIASYFAARNISLQFLRVADPIATSGATIGQAWPTVVNAVMYPAGTWVVGKAPVIDLDTVYDSAGLKLNRYTAAFFEEGILVANTCYGSSLVQITATSAVGETGAANLASGA